MIYIYDIILNFNKDYYEFFQWKKSDKILNVKKIPAFKVSDSDLYNFKHNDVIVDKDFISKISDISTTFFISSFLRLYIIHLVIIIIF